MNGTEEFYANYLAKKMDKEPELQELRVKRESLANTLK